MTDAHIKTSVELRPQLLLSRSERMTRRCNATLRNRKTCPYSLKINFRNSKTPPFHEKPSPNMPLSIHMHFTQLRLLLMMNESKASRAWLSPTLRKQYSSRKCQRKHPSKPVHSTSKVIFKTLVNASCSLLNNAITNPT